MALSGTDSRVGDLIEVVYNPVRKPAGRGGAAPASLRAPDFARTPRRVVGQVGRITPQKGHHVLLRAAGRLRRDGFDIHVVFVGAPEANNCGDAAYVESLQRLTRDLGLVGRVHWTGYQTDPYAFYAAFDVIAIPSTVSEGLPMVALEALQAGLPVVGSSVGGIPEIIRDGWNGFLAAPGDEQALAQALERVIGRDDIRRRLQAAARSSIDSRFSVRTFRNRIRAAISQLCPAPERAEQRHRELRRRLA